MTQWIRNSFGLKDPKTKEQYQDIIKAHREVHTIGPKNLFHKNLFGYELLCDSILKRELAKNNEIRVLVSFQERTTGRFAVARLLSVYNNIQRKHNN